MSSVWKKSFLFLAAPICFIALSATPGAGQPTSLFPIDQWSKVKLSSPESLAYTPKLDRPTNFEPMKRFSKRSRFRQLASSVARLKVRIRTREGKMAVSSCTAFLISPDDILTNYHCVPGKDGAIALEAVARFNYLDDIEAKGDVYPVSIEPVESNFDLDYSVLKVEGNPSQKYAILKLGHSDPDPGEELFIIHHPQGLPMRITRRSCFAHAKPLTKTEIRHQCDTMGGSSGSPLFSGRTNQLVGLHFLGGAAPDDPESFNMAKRLSVIFSQSRLLQSLANNAAAAQKPPRKKTPPHAVAMSNPLKKSPGAGSETSSLKGGPFLRVGACYDVNGKLFPIRDGMKLYRWDRYTLYFQTSILAHVYIFQVDTGGRVVRLFPNPRFQSGKNPVSPQVKVRVPSGKKAFLRLDQNKGGEQILFFASPGPVPSLEKPNPPQLADIARPGKILGNNLSSRTIPGNTFCASKPPKAGQEAMRISLGENKMLSYRLWFMHE